MDRRLTTVPPVSAQPLRTLVVLGTRPEAIKLAPVIRTLRADPRFRVRVVATGQHRELLTPLLDAFGLGTDVDLGLVRRDGSLNRLARLLIARMDSLFTRLSPDVVLVQGDTTSAWCAALVAFHQRLPVAHVEAGLRSFDRFQPWPEESNRRMIGVVADLHLAPTQGCADNLLREGTRQDDVLVTGNTAVDALLAALERGRAEDDRWLDKLALRGDGRLALVTLHRRESWARVGPSGEAPLHEILRGLREAARANPRVDFVYPVHPNPRVREAAVETLGACANVHLVPPVDYVPFVRAMLRATVIVSDSGGIQEEAPSLGVALLVVRQRTERPEGLETATNRLVEPTAAGIVDAVQDALDRPLPRPDVLPCPSPFGDGRASDRIARALLHRFRDGAAPEAFRPAAHEAFPAAARRDAAPRPLGGAAVSYEPSNRLVQR